MDKMEYNSTRDKLIIPEYGRNIQKMVKHVVELEDRDERNKAAAAVVKVMSQIQGLKTESEEQKHKLWDHLYIISDFKLDIDAPFPPPERDTPDLTPEKMSYNDKRMRYRHYGKNILAMINKAADYEEGEEKEAFILAIANHMKKAYLTWSRDTVTDDLILENLKELSEGRIVRTTETVQLQDATVLVTQSKQQQKKKKNKKKGRN